MATACCLGLNDSNTFIFLVAESRKSVSYTFFVAEVEVSPWDVVQQFAPPPSVVCVEDMKNINTDFGKVC